MAIKITFFNIVIMFAGIFYGFKTWKVSVEQKRMGLSNKRIFRKKDEGNIWGIYSSVECFDCCYSNCYDFYEEKGFL